MVTELGFFSHKTLIRPCRYFEVMSKCHILCHNLVCTPSDVQLMSWKTVHMPQFQENVKT